MTNILNSLSKVQSGDVVMSVRDLFPAELYYLSELPSKLVWTDVLGIAMIAVLLAFLATLYPAWKAANTDPVEVLRNE